MAAESVEIELPGPVARAIAVGHAEFAQTGDAIERFDVIVRLLPDAFEVVFVPEQTPGHSVRGGRTDAGRERHYWVSATDFTLLRSTYAR
jgi:hypothetical protein